MDIVLTLLLAIAWVLISILSFLMLIIFRDQFDLDKLFSNMRTRTKNILVRIYVILGPISFALSLVIIMLWMVYTMFHEIIKWLIDIDNEDIL